MTFHPAARPKVGGVYLFVPEGLENTACLATVIDGPYWIERDENNNWGAGFEQISYDPQGETVLVRDEYGAEAEATIWELREIGDLI